MREHSHARHVDTGFHHASGPDNDNASIYGAVAHHHTASGTFATNDIAVRLRVAWPDRSSEKNGTQPAGLATRQPLDGAASLDRARLC